MRTPTGSGPTVLNRTRALRSRLRSPHRAGLSLVAVLGTVALTAGCQVAEGERPVETPSVSAEDVTAVPTPSDLDVVPVIDVSAGGPQDTDAVWQGLTAAAEAGQNAYVHAWIHTYQEVPEEGEVSLTPDTPDSVTVTVDDASAVTAGEEGFHLIDATVGVEQLGDSAFVLTVEDTETRAELLPKGPDDEARCTAADGNERIQAASQVLADVLREDDAEQREELRLQWGASPAVWWGIQRTAISLVDTDGDTAGDFLLEACTPFLDGEAPADDASEDADSADDEDASLGDSADS